MEKVDFITINIETANIDSWSICQAGLASFHSGEIVETWCTFVNPQTIFDTFNVNIHGITEKAVMNSINLSEFYDLINKKISGQTVIHHTAFTRTAFRLLADHINRDPIDCLWLDSARIARQTWTEVRNRGYGLSDLSNILGMPQYEPRNALNNAIITGKIVNEALKNNGKTIDEWKENALHNYSLWGNSLSEYMEIIHADPNPDGILYGECIVFTGSLSITRLEASKIAFALGCDIEKGVTKKTTILVVGDQDIRYLAGYEKSSKHRKAEELKQKGQPIRIIGEADFMALVNLK